MKAILIAALAAMALALIGCETSQKQDSMGDKHHGMMMMMASKSSMKCEMCAKGSAHNHSSTETSEKAPEGHQH
jgi:hypothetical protein